MTGTFKLELATDDTSTTPAALPEASSSYYGPTGFHWLLKGRFGGMPRPGLLRPIDDDLASIKRVGVSLVVTLTEEWEPPVAKMDAVGIQSLYVPIPDMQPPTVEQANSTCTAVAEHVSDESAVVFHCHGGRGRTGTLLAALLIWYSPNSEAAINQVKTANQSWIESTAQLNFLEEFAKNRQYV